MGPLKNNKNKHMKNIIIILIALVSFTVFSQSKYETEMEKALGLWGAEKSWEAVNLFERIATAEPEEWLPSYYASLVTVVQCFGEKDEAKLTANLDRALTFMNDAKAISKDNPEILLLDALWHTAWVAYDGVQYGMKYGAKVTQMYQEALNIAPNSPRVLLNKAEWDMGGAVFFGQPIDPYCKDVEKAIELFEDFQPEGKFYPTYGLERAQQIMESSCKK
jgi:tetratricopeptide (TPR) repeat protein